jgi:hypothetical protein
MGSTSHGSPFRAAAIMMASLAVLAATHAPGSVAFNQAASGMAYQGRGKGRTRMHDNGGTAVAKRAATKRRNIKRYRANCKGA